MKLSLNILKEWLEKYDPVCSIQNGKRTIRNVRIFSDDLEIVPNNVYVGRTGGDSGDVICMHENDYMILSSQDENQILNEIMDAFDFYNGWSDGIQEDLNEMTLDEIIKAGSKALKGYLVLADASYYIHAYSPSSAALDDPLFHAIEDRHIMDITNILSIEKHPGIRVRNPHCYVIEDSSLPMFPCVRNLFTGGRHWGWLIAADTVHTPGQMDIEEELADHLERWMRLHSDEQNQMEKNSVLLSILDQSYESRSMAEYRLKVLKWKEDAEIAVYVFDPPQTALALFRKVSDLFPALHVLIYGDRLTAVFSGTDRERSKMEKDLLLFLKQSQCSCGASPVFKDIFLLHEQYELALTAAEKCGTDMGKGIILHFPEIAFPYGLDLLKRECGGWLIHPAVQRLKEYDRENHTEFTETCRIYLQCERNIARTARVLSVHRNTLLYRIERIREIVHADLEDHEVRLHLLLSFALESDPEKTVGGEF